jgi:hypothetical protein
MPPPEPAAPLPKAEIPTRKSELPPPRKTEVLPTYTPPAVPTAGLLPPTGTTPTPVGSQNQATAKLPTPPSTPPAGKLSPPPSTPPAGKLSPPPNTPNTPPPNGRQNRILLIGGGCLLGIIVLALLAFVTIKAIATFLPPAETPRPTANSTPTAETARSTNVSIIQTSQAEQDATASAEPAPTTEPTLEPSVEPTSAPTLTPRSLLPKATPIDAPTPTEAIAPTDEPTPTEEIAPTPTEAASIIVTSFSDKEAQDFRTAHDKLVKTYKQLLFESFEEGNRTKARWNHGVNGRQLLNNRYEITIDQPNIYNSDYWKGQPANLSEEYTVELEVRFPTLEKLAVAGIAFDVQPDNTKNWLYLIGNNGNWYIFRNEQRIASGALPAKFDINANTPYVLWVWRTPVGLLFFFNGELIAVAPKAAIGDDFPTGKVGVVGVSGKNESDVPVTVYVDNFLVKRK